MEEIYHFNLRNIKDDDHFAICNRCNGPCIQYGNNPVDVPVCIVCSIGLYDLNNETEDG